MHCVSLPAYDGLIENNSRRIAILEEMARRIFEEWFVHFRAPGCEGLPMVDSAIGPAPQGWNAGPLERLAEYESANVDPRRFPQETLLTLAIRRLTRNIALPSRPVTPSKAISSALVLLSYCSES